MMICLISAKDSDKSYELKEDPVQQRILESTKTFRNQHDMNHVDSIRQTVKLRKDLFMDVWPDHNIKGPSRRFYMVKDWI